jgi:hypothetical protein
MLKTEVVSYKSQGAMQSDINRRERQGYTVMSVTRNGQGWGVAKTVVLGAIFLPLAVFGKKGDVFQVTYQREKTKGFLEIMAEEAERKKRAKSAP